MFFARKKPLAWHTRASIYGCHFAKALKNIVLMVCTIRALIMYF
jgi:hypothetical protein